MPASPDRGTRQALLHHAREAIASRLRGGTAPPSPDFAAQECSGVFVTVRVADALRGCIGFLRLQDGLADTIADAAVRAATEDPRFPPVLENELDALRIEVTLLGPMERIVDANDFTIGMHGLVLEHKGRRGLLLPQVAVENGWDRARFLSALCRKAQLADRAWEWPDAVLSRFEGKKFSEEDHDVERATPASGAKE